MMQRHTRRHGFTLLELLVVLAIIAVLAALTAAAVFQVQDAQRGSTTESTMRAVAQVLMKQWEAVIDQANKEDLPPGVLAMSGSDANAGRRARVLWKLIRLRQEFPMNVGEACADFPVGVSIVPAKKTYLDALNNVKGKWYTENATCLLLAVQEMRGGSSLSPDSLPGSISTKGINGQKMLVDGYGKEMILYRFPTGCQELINRNPAKSGSRSANTSASGDPPRFSNPLDPEGTLTDSAWNYWDSTAASPSAGVLWFEANFFPIHKGTDASYKPSSTYMVPTLVSAGRNGRYGFSFSIPSDPDPMPPDWSMTELDANNANDNIYSFRLGFDKRGN